VTAFEAPPTTPPKSTLVFIEALEPICTTFPVAEPLPRMPPNVTSDAVAPVEGFVFAINFTTSAPIVVEDSYCCAPVVVIVSPFTTAGPFASTEEA